MTPAERFDLSRIAPQPWKNGAGLTREVAACRDDSAVGFSWRISVADVARDAPFSAFPGVDRCIVLLQGAGMRLRSDDGSIDQLLARPHEPFHFSGDLPLAATLIEGASRDLNVMARRGVLRCEVVHHTAAGGLPGRGDEAAGVATMLFCTQGEWHVYADADVADDATDPHAPLSAMQALLWRGPTGPIAFRPAGAQGAVQQAPAAHLLCVTLHAA